MTSKAKVEIEKIYPLSPMQENLLYYYLSDQAADAYFEQDILPISGNIDVALLEQSVNRLIQHYPALRSVFVYEKIKKPRMVVKSHASLNIKYEDLSHLEKGKRNLLYKTFLAEDKSKKFDLTRDVLIRITLFKTGEQRYKLVWSFHHIIMDGWCMGILYRDLIDIYQSLASGRPLHLEPPVPYENYIRWLDSRDKEQSLEYWRAYLEGYEQPATFPKFKQNTETGGYKLGEHRFRIDEHLTSSLKLMAASNHVTMNTIFQTLWGLLLQRYNNSGDVVFGVLVSGRNPEVPGIDSIVGVFINTIPLRIRCAGTDTLDSVLRKVQSGFSASKDHEYVPLGEIQGLSSLKYHLIDHIMVFQNYPFKSQQNTKEAAQSTTATDANLESKSQPSTNIGFQIEGMKSREQTNYDLNLFVADDDKILVKFSYNRRVYSEDFVKKLAANLIRLVEQAAASPRTTIKNLDIVSNEERSRILYRFNDTVTQYPEEKTIHSLFEQQSLLRPDAVAMVIGNRHITFAQLNRRASILASILEGNGVGDETVVALLVNRSIEMIVAILAVLKAGGAYLPIDLDYPPDRMIYMLNDSAARLLLTGDDWQWYAKFEEMGYDYPGKVIELFDPKLYTAIDTSNQSAPPGIAKTEVTAESAAYVVYTSGSTGRPKGIAVKHRNVVNFIHGMKSNINFAPGKNILALTTISFDIFVLETLLPLTLGLKIIMASEIQQQDTLLLQRLMRNQNISIMQVTPSRLKIILDSLSPSDSSLLNGIREILVGGEAFPEKLLHRLKEKYEGYIYNMYGPAETTVWSSMKDLTGQRAVTVGTPIANTSIHILDLYGQPQPIGVAGELCIGGHGVARGYVNRPELTGEKFLGNMYRTGDQARWLGDGDIQFLGRIDNQVKVRGHRIELGEIEHCLLRFTGSRIKEAVVTVREDADGDKYLSAYYIPSQPFEEPELREYCSAALPVYMIPSYFTPMESFKLTPNGKIDRFALPAPQQKTSLDAIAPRTIMEKQLASIWQEVIGKNKDIPGIDENFFYLGGHSVKAMELVARIHALFNVRISPADIFKTPTIRTMAMAINSASKEVHSADKVLAAEKRQYYPLSPAQVSLYFLQTKQAGNLSCNMPSIVRMNGGLNISRVKDTFKLLIQRHEGLRTSFHMIAEGLVQRVHEKVDFDIPLLHMTEEEAKEAVAAFVTPFDLTKAPLLRISVIETTPDTHILMMDMNHIITDALSMDTLLKEFNRLYRGKALPPVPVQYKDYVLWLKQQEREGRLKEQEKYWLKKFNESVPVLNLPLDYPRPATASFQGRHWEFQLDDEKTLRVKQLAKDHNVTVYMVLLAVYTIMLSKVGDSDDIVVLTPASIRGQLDLHHVMGIFLNMLAMRNFPTGDKTFSIFLKEVKSNALDAYQNQDYPFDSLAEKLSASAGLGGGWNPVSTIAFDFQTRAMKENDDSAITAYDYQYEATKYDITLMGFETPQHLSFRFEYCTALFKQKTMERFETYFKGILSTVLDNPYIQIGEIKSTGYLMVAQTNVFKEENEDQDDWI